MDGYWKIVGDVFFLPWRYFPSSLDRKAMTGQIAWGRLRRDLVLEGGLLIAGSHFV